MEGRKVWQGSASDPAGIGVHNPVPVRPFLEDRKIIVGVSGNVC